MGASIGGLVGLGAIGLCVLGWKRRGKDLKHLAWIERRGTVKGRTELDAVEVGQRRGGEVFAFGARNDSEPPVREEGDRNNGDGRGGGGESLRSQSDIVSPVSPMESSPGQRNVEPAAGEGGGVATHEESSNV